jgi:hypothetical protein
VEGDAAVGPEPVAEAFRHMMRRSGCAPPLPTMRRDAQSMSPVWAEDIPLDAGGPAARPAAPAAVTGNASDDAAAPPDAFALMRARSAYDTRPRGAATQPLRRLAVVLVPQAGRNTKLENAVAAQFNTTFVIASGKSHILACNRPRKGNRGARVHLFTCASHVLQHYVGARFTDVTVVDLTTAAGGGTACTVRDVLQRSNAERARGRSLLHMVAGRPAGSKKRRRPACALWPFYEGMAYHLTEEEERSRWTVQPPAAPGVAPPAAAAYVAAAYAAAEVRLLHVPQVLFPFYAAVADSWRLYDVGHHDGGGLLFDVLRIKEAALRLTVVRDDTAAAVDEKCVAHRVVVSDAALRSVTEIKAEGHNKGFLKFKTVQPAWSYPVANASSTADALPDRWRASADADLWRRSPAVLWSVKLALIVRRPFVAKWVAAMQQRFRRLLLITDAATPFNDRFFPAITPFCLGNDDFTGCFMAMTRRRFFQRAGGILFMHGDFYMVPSEFLTKNDLNDIIVATNHPLTEHRRHTTIPSEQGPPWMFPTSATFSEAHGWRPSSGYVHLREAQTAFGSYYQPLYATDAKFRDLVGDTVQQVVFGDLSYFPARVLDVANGFAHTLFPQVLMSEPATGYFASLTALVTRVARTAHRYWGGCCHNLALDEVQTGPGGHKFPMGKEPFVEAARARLEASFACTATVPAVERDGHAAGALFAVSNTTCDVAVEWVGVGQTTLAKLHVANPATNAVRITAEPVAVPATVMRRIAVPGAGGKRKLRSVVAVEAMVVAPNVNRVVFDVAAPQTTDGDAPPPPLPVDVRIVLVTGVFQRTTVTVRHMRDMGNATALASNATGARRCAFVLNEDDDTLVVRGVVFPALPPPPPPAGAAAAARPPSVLRPAGVLAIVVDTGHHNTSAVTVFVQHRDSIAAFVVKKTAPPQRPGEKQ